VTYDREIEFAYVRTILNSQGGLSVEAELHVPGATGTGSAPRAIIAGRRERRLSEDASLGRGTSDPRVKALLTNLRGRHLESQDAFDDIFGPGSDWADLGSDISLALSLAYCRAQAAAANETLQQRLSTLGGFVPAMPYPIVNIFSGGVHGGRIPFQQLMIIPRGSDILNNVSVAVSVYGEVENEAKSKDWLTGYSASSGMLTTLSDLRQLFDIISAAVERMGLSREVALGTDVAAEHLELGRSLYRLHPDQPPVTLDELALFHRSLLADYNFCFFEDPFGPDDAVHWRALTAEAGHRTMIVGDDLFATNADNIDPGLATGILLKMNQIGTLSGTLKAATTARAAGMRLCVSHRSKETEDTAMCDLAVGLGADLIKIGGPRRGDRIAKYNQLMRLSERLLVADQAA
jgi:enolase